MADAAVGFGLLFFYSSAADAVTAEADLVSVIADVAVVVVTTMAIAANGLSFFLFSSAVADAVTTVPAANFFTGVVLPTPSYISNVA